MSFVAPYGDLTARGKFNQAVTFRRRGNSVVMMGTPRPKPTRTPGQVAQRNRFSVAAESYKTLFFETRQFYNSRARLISKSGRNIYMSAHIQNKLPSVIPGIPIKTVDNMYLSNPAGTLDNNLKVSVAAGAITPQEAGCFLWTKLNDLPSTITPEIGPVGSPIGTLFFVPGKFGNALENTGQARFIQYPLGDQNFTEFVYGVWWQPHFDSTSSFRDRGIVLFFNSEGGGFDLRFADYNDPTAPRKVFFELRDPDDIKHINYYFDHPGFTAESWHHLLFAFNNVWGDGGRVRFYFDGIPMNIFLIEQDDSYEPIGQFTCRIPGSTKAMAANDNAKAYSSTEYLSGIIDNINNEDFAVPPFIPFDYGSVEDNSNIFTPGFAGAGTPVQTVTIEETAGVGAVIPFFYPVWVYWTDSDDNVNNSIIRLPEIKLDPDQVVTLYLSKDFSDYHDSTFRRLAGTGKELF